MTKAPLLSPRLWGIQPRPPLRTALTGESRLSTPDIFISYARPDAEAARRMAEGFAAEGLEVWWDNSLQAGEVFDEAIENALRSAKAVVVLWSPHSVASRWVRAEATLADRKKTLVPALIAPCERPIIFELTQTTDLCHWQGDASDKVWKTFLTDVRAFVGRAVDEALMSGPAATAALPKLDQVSIAVLPFTNMSGDPEQEYFADGISEDVITDLSKVSALSVISRNTAFSFKGKSIDLRQVANQLNVTHVLEGSVRKSGNRVRITAQLIEGSSDNHVWAERWDRDLDDIFALQDELSQEIVKALKLKLLPSEKKAIEQRPTSSVEAHDLYMRARAAGSAANSIEGYVAAFELFKQVLEIDPLFTPALGGLAIEALQVVNAADMRREAVLGDLEACYLTAVVHAPEDWATQLLFATCRIVEGNPIVGFEAFEKAMAVAPSFDTDVAYNYASLLGVVGRINDAVELLEAARRIDPLSAILSALLQILYLCAGQFDEARLEYERFRKSGADREEMEHNALFQVWLEGDLDATRAQYRRFLGARAIPIPELDACIDLIDQHEAALVILRKGLEAPENQEGIKQFLLALHVALHGEHELAMAGLRRAAFDYKSVSPYMLWYPFLRDVRQLPGFKQLVRDLGLYDYWRKSGNWGDFARPLGDDDFELIG